MNRYLLALSMLAPALAACGAPSPEPDSGSHDAGSTGDARADAGPDHDVFVEAGLDEEIVSRFGAAAPSAIAPPEIVYPETGTLVPPNLVAVDIHFRSAVEQAFEIVFAQSGRPAVVVYVACAPVGDGCVFQPWPEVWRALAARRAAGPYAIRIRALAGDEATAPSEPVVLELADEAIQGGIYYLASDYRWESTDAPETIRRYELDVEHRSAEAYLAPSELVPWHVVSVDGSRIAVTTQRSTGGSRTQTYDVATRAPIGAVIESAALVLPRLGPDHDMLFSADQAGVGDAHPIRIVRASDGSVLREWSFGAAHSADWSADGARIVFSVAVGTLGEQVRHELRVLERSEDGDWGEPRALPTPDTLGAEDPSFAPGAEWIGYGARDTTDGEVAWGVTTYAPLLVAMRISDGRAVQLRRALGPHPDRYREQPSHVRWSPSAYRHQGRVIFWLTFSSARDCGLLPQLEEMHGGATIDTHGPQIWVAAFDPEADPDDPSRPAFRLPAQRWGRVVNQRAEWALTVRRQPCTDDPECPDGQLCQDGFCDEAPE